MTRRAVLIARQRAALFELPTDNTTMLRHYVLSEEDLAHVQRRRRDRNPLGFALQLCAFRYPGRLIAKGETIPEAMTHWCDANPVDYVFANAHNSGSSSAARKTLEGP